MDFIDLGRHVGMTGRGGTADARGSGERDGGPDAGDVEASPCPLCQTPDPQPTTAVDLHKTVAGFGHDLNNLLSAVLSAVQILNENSLGQAIESADDRQEILRGAEHATLRACDLARQLLNFGSPQAPAREPTCINETIQEVIGLIRRTLPASINASVSLDSRVPVVMLDQGRLYQAILNLCLNARDAMQDGGVLHLSTVLDTETGLDPETGPAGRRRPVIRIGVQDTGVGISQEDQEKIARPFYTRRRAGHGTGLGLFMTQRFVQNHGGSLVVSSELGIGSIFEILLPIDVAEVTAASVGAANVSPPEENLEAI